MSTATPGKTDRYVEFDEYVEFQLEKTRKSIKSNDLMTAAAAAGAILLSGLLAFVVLDHWIISGGFGVTARWCWFIGFTVVITGWLFWKVGVPTLWSVNRLFAAKELEQADPKLRGNLLNWVDLRAAGRAVNPTVMQTIEKQAATELSKMDVGQAVDHQPLLNASYALLAIVVLFCGYALLSPKKISSALWRILPFTTSGAVTRTVIQEVTPGDATLLARGQLEVAVQVTGEIPPDVQMLYSTADGRVQDEAVVLRPETDGLPRFRGLFAGESGNGVLQNFTYYIVAGDAKSTLYHVTVHHPPSATVHEVTLTSPEYMHLDVATNSSGHIDGWEGAVATVSATSDKPCRSAVLQFLNDAQSQPTGEELPVQVAEGTQLTATWKLEFRSDGTFPKHYRIQCRNDAGEADPSPAIYNIAIKPDRPPEVVLLFPERDLDAPANAVIPLLVQASDPDFELGYVNLMVEKDGHSIHRSPLSEGRQQSATLKHNLELAGMSLKPGDEIQLWVEAFDNKQPRRNRKNTPRLKIHIIEPVTKDEAKEQLADQQDERDQRLAEAQQEQNRQENREENAEPNEGDDRDERDPKDGDPGDQPQTAENKADGAQEDKNSATENSREQAEGKSDPKSNAAPGTGDSESANSPSDSKSEPNESPLDAGGEDDAEALRRINEQLNKQPPPPADKPKGEPQPKPAAGQKKPSPKPGDSAESSEPGETSPNESEESAESSQEQRAKSGRKPPQNGQNQKQTPTANSPADDKEASPTADEEMPGESESAAVPQPKSEQKPGPNRQNSNGKMPTGDESKTAPKTEDGQPSPTDPADDTPPSNGSKEELKSGEKPPQSKATGKKSPPKPSADQDQTTSEKTEPMPGNPNVDDDVPGQSSDLKNQQEQQPSAPSTSQQKKPADPKSKDPQQKPPGDKTAPAADQQPRPKTDPMPQEGDPENDEQKSQSPSPNAAQKKKPSSNPGKPSQSKSSPASGDSEPSESADSAQSESDSSDSNSSEESPSSSQPSSKKPSGKNGKSPSPQNPSGKQSAGKQQSPEKSAPTGDDPAADDPSPAASNGDKNQRPGEGNESKPEERPSKQKAGRNNPNAKKTDAENSEETPDGDQPNPTARQKTDGNPNAADEEMKGPGAKEGQKSDQPQGGEGGASKQDKEGNPGSETEGPGEQTDKPGDEAVAKDKTGKPDPKQRPGNGAATKPGEQDGGEQPGKPEGKQKSANSGEKPGNDPGGESPDGSKPSNQKSGGPPSDATEEGGAGDAPTEGSPKSTSSSSQKPGSPTKGGKAKGQKPGNASNSEGGGATENGETPGGGNDVETQTDPEAANLEYNRQAAELVLQRLKDDLNSDQVDPKLLEELGWTPEQLQKFVDRLARQLEKPAADLSPQDEARRRQFEEMLKTIDLKNTGSKRSGENSPQREIDQSGARRAPVASEYKASWEALTKSLSKKNTPGKKGTAPAAKKR